MGSFECLPREIWEIILFYGGNSVKKGRVMAVNKHWYNMFLSITFTAPFIRLSCDRSKYHDIVNSPFHPGQWTTSITFRFFKVEKEFIEDITQSKLYRLMVHTPHVKQVFFSQIDIVDAQDWDYFYKVLKTADVWKLRCLPDNWDLGSIDNRIDMKSVYSTYLKCAQHLKDSLGLLTLIKKPMSTPKDLSYLNGFNILTSLNITQGFLENVYDLDILLQHTPQLEELEIDFKDTNFGSNDRSEIAILNGVYPRIKRLTFYHFKFEMDSQVSIFYTNFTGLQKLHLACVESQILLKPETAKSFFIMLTSLSDYNISFQRNIIHVSEFINENCQKEVHAIVSGNQKSDDSIHISKKQFSPKTLIEYKIHTNGIASRDAAKCILSGLGKNIRQLTLFYLGEKDYYWKALFGIQHENLNSIVFNRLLFKTLNKTDFIYTNDIKNITFDHCVFSKPALRVFSDCFTKLDKVNFEGCDFDNSFLDPWVNIIMPKTDIRHLCISYDVPFSASYEIEEERWDFQKIIERPRAFPLISITLLDEDMTRYYYTRDERVPVVVETTSTQFILLAEGVPYRSFTKIINVYVQSLRELSLKLSSNRSKDIQMVFKQ